MTAARCVSCDATVVQGDAVLTPDDRLVEGRWVGPVWHADCWQRRAAA